MKKQTSFPTTLQQAILYFSDANNCSNFLSQMRWPNGVECPVCDSREVSYLSTRRLWKCKACKKQFSVKVGSIMEDSPIGLDRWMAAIWLIANAKNGISSCELARSLGMTQKSAWFVLHRIRKAMQNGSLGKLSGHVEVDETFIGGLARNFHISKRKKLALNGFVGKVAVMGLLERHGGEARQRGVPARLRIAAVGQLEPAPRLLLSSRRARVLRRCRANASHGKAASGKSAEQRGSAGHGHDRSWNVRLSTTTSGGIDRRRSW